MKKILNIILIRKPMMVNFFLTILSSVAMTLLYFYSYFSSIGKWDISLYFSSTSKWDIFLYIVLYPILMFLFIFLNYKRDFNDDIGDIKYQIRNISNIKNSPGILFINVVICTIYYVITGYTIQKCILENFNSWTHIEYVEFIPIVIIFALLIIRILYLAINISPFIIIGQALILLILASIFGIEDSLLGWTFLTLIFGTVTIPLLSFDIVYLLPKEYRDRISKNDKIKEELNRKKYSFIILIPVIYFILFISEKISNSDNFIYLVNIMFSSHFEEVPKEFFSPFTLCISILKTILFSISIAVYYTYKDIFLDAFLKRTIDEVKKIEGLSISTQKYFKLSYSKKNFSRKYKIDKNHFLLKENKKNKKNIIVEYIQNDKNEYKFSKDSIWTSSKNNKLIKVISKEILKIDNNYFVLNGSDIFRKLENGNVHIPEYKFKKIDFSVLLLPIVISICFLGMTYIIEKDVNNITSGAYYRVSENNKKSTERIEFKGDNVYFIDSVEAVPHYKFNKASLTIKDINNNRVGEIDRKNETITITDQFGNEKRYIHLSINNQ
jgi:membrane protein